MSAVKEEIMQTLSDIISNLERLKQRVSNLEEENKRLNDLVIDYKSKWEMEERLMYRYLHMENQAQIEEVNNGDANQYRNCKEDYLRSKNIKKHR